ncbi:TPA: phosphoribosyltransferase domain-containing protein [Providencia stuartii]|uniref:phosphoribosyltransferase domain-containing protein n=1 Tax=Providencia stuartii TaxID=588 RepID=UPI00123999DD|nr:phosphoribosyltransferase domain-containing protein [Providencia stuartii]QET97702.1 adenine/guanine phosphoribosyltransferase [Providencia stuartii]HEM8143322.1 phosphoribosyltransferase domain-containing protein [Providencia stuartii]HEM8874301.1 phosphoribosyltransferase domain-containing protein [Providencia stuartii]
MKSTTEPVVYRRNLTTGTLSVIPTCSLDTLDELFEIAERRNPKRAFLFVSKVLGRHIPVQPKLMRKTYQQLCQQFPSTLEGPVLFIGMAETAVGLGAGVFDEARKHYKDSVYLTSTRHPVEGGELLCEFKENHSHATDHLLYLPHDPELRRRVLHAQTVVLVDDEATTGNTFINLLCALRDAGGLTEIKQVIAVTLTDWSGDALQERSPLPIRTLSLVQGQWQWQQNKDAPVPIMPNVNITGTGHFPITGKQSWGRLGIAAPAGDLGRHIQASSDEKILVLGSGEFVWEPFLLAERLEQQGAEVKYSSTTRSPISVNYAIQSAIAFKDNYGLGIPNFVYNVAHQHFSRIILCIETPKESVDSVLLEALNKVAPIVEVLSYE